MSIRGRRVDRLQCTKATTSSIERNRLLVITKATNTAAYATYGSVVDGITTNLRAEEASDVVAVYPINSLRETFFVHASRAIAAVGSLLFPVADGKVVASEYTCTTRGLKAEPTPGADVIYLVPSDGTGTNWVTHRNSVAVYTHATTSWAFVDVSSTANLGLTVYISDEKRYYTWNGTSWTAATACAIANEIANAAQEIEAYNVKSMGTIDVNALPANSNFGIALMGQYSGNPGGTTVTILDTRIAAGDKAICQFQGATTMTTIKAVCTAGTLTLTLGADSGANTLITYIVVRQL